MSLGRGHRDENGALAADAVNRPPLLDSSLTPFPLMLGNAPDFRKDQRHEANTEEDGSFCLPEGPKCLAKRSEATRYPVVCPVFRE
jgi:hypothetical protein